MQYRTNQAGVLGAALSPAVRSAAPLPRACASYLIREFNNFLTKILRTERKIYLKSVTKWGRGWGICATQKIVFSVNNLLKSEEMCKLVGL